MSQNKISRQVEKVAVKRKALEDISARRNKMIDSEVRLNPDHLQHLTTKDMQYVRYNAYYARQKVRPKRPRKIEEACEKLTAYQAKTSTNEDFLYHLNRDRKIVVFTYNKNLRILRNTEMIYMDGTFQYCAKYFLQLFTLHGLLK